MFISAEIKTIVTVHAPAGAPARLGRLYRVPPGLSCQGLAATAPCPCGAVPPVRVRVHLRARRARDCGRRPPPIPLSFDGGGGAPVVPLRPLQERAQAGGAWRGGRRVRLHRPAGAHSRAGSRTRTAGSDRRRQGRLDRDGRASGDACACWGGVGGAAPPSRGASIRRGRGWMRKPSASSGLRSMSWKAPWASSRVLAPCDQTNLA